MTLTSVQVLDVLLVVLPGSDKITKAGHTANFRYFIQCVSAFILRIFIISVAHFGQRQLATESHAQQPDCRFN